MAPAFKRFLALAAAGAVFSAFSAGGLEALDGRPYWLPGEKGPQAGYWESGPNLKADDLYRDGDVTAVPYWQTPSTGPPENGPDGEALEEDRAVVSYYAYRDEKGQLHLSDRRLDSRYQEKTLTVELSMVSGRMNFLFDRNSLKPYILAAAQRENLDPALIAAVIETESAFDHLAVSWAGAQGLMQLMPATAKMVGCLDPFNPQANIDGGGRYLRILLDRFKGDLNLALAAYNCGPERVRGKIPEIRETKNYVKKVLENARKYQARF